MHFFLFFLFLSISWVLPNAAAISRIRPKVCLALKAPITTAADDIHKYIFIVFQKKIRLDSSSESSARQRIHMKNQALFSSKYRSKK